MNGASNGTSCSAATPANAGPSFTSTAHQPYPVPREPLAKAFDHRLRRGAVVGRGKELHHPFVRAHRGPRRDILVAARPQQRRGVPKPAVKISDVATGRQAKVAAA